MLQAPTNHQSGVTQAIPWLLAGPPYVVYRTRRDLLGQPDDHPQVLAARRALLAEPRVQALLAELADWPRPVLKSHKAAGHPLHKLVFLADLGLRQHDPGMDAIIGRILAHRSSAGPFQVIVNISPRYGGSGQEQYAWMLCDAPLVLYALARFGLGGDPRVQAAVEHLVGLLRANGWPCAVSPNLGRFRGPGRKADPCPYANLLMLKLLARFPAYHAHPALQNGVETLLALWQQRKERRPYLFAMGTGFSKLKAPLIWYDLLHLTDVLSQVPRALQDRRLREMLSLLREQADQEGRFTPGSVWRPWAGWDFGQKKKPSRWLTLLAWRILQRAA